MLWGLTEGHRVSHAFDGREYVNLTVWASACAAVSVVAKSVDVHATLSVGIVARDIIGDGGWGTLGVLLEGHGALDIGVTTENCDCGALSAIHTVLTADSSTNAFVGYEGHQGACG